MVIVKAIKEFSQGGLTRLSIGDELEVKAFGGRYFMNIVKQKDKVQIPSGCVVEIEDFTPIKEEVEEAIK